MKKLLLLCFITFLISSCSGTRGKGMFGDLFSGKSQKSEQLKLDSLDAIKADSIAKRIEGGLTPEQEMGLMKLPEKEVSISGRVIGADGLNIILDKMSVGKIEPIFSQDLNKKGDFQFIIKIRQPELLQLRIGQNVIHIPVKPGEDLYFDINAENPTNFSLQGSLEPVHLREAYFEIEKINDLKDQIEHDMDDASNSQNAAIMLDTMNKEIRRLDMRKSLALRKIIDKADSEFVGLILSARLDGNLNIEYLLKVDKKYGKIFPYSQFYKDLHEKVLAYAPTAIGKLAPEILVNDPSGKEIRLSQFRGKNVIINFWNSDCQTCQVDEFDALEKLKKKNKRSLEIFNINIDNEKQTWLESISGKDLPFTNVHDQGGFQSPVVGNYLVSSMPYNVVIDKNGTIVGRDLRGDKLIKKIESLK